ncbi:amino acid ABC transporter substrate-binding protein [Leisingera daeponensis]|uniref:amino acid ABC transporter substrate-binding protein n=1 Tax=Leisingera daeponensis TaxID=405746 RepID=UPI001C95FE96|nr:amino acid ABC transporter substrate-binding protein [Leisingera daeponensis]MBY6058759.1 amino acid ABC transporter substrate-binding protein [Leisingera daeponensis]
MIKFKIGSLTRRTLMGLFTAAAVSSLPQLAAAQESVIKIGAPLALTGGLAEEGHKQAEAYKLWLTRINEAGGIDVGGEKYKIELVTYDYQTDGNRAQQLAETLITRDKVDFMTAPFGSGHTKIVAGVAERYGVPIVAVASSEPVHDQGYTNLFGTLSPSLGLITSMLNHFKEVKPDLKSIAIVGRDDVFPKIMADVMEGAAPDAGIEVVYKSLFPVGSLDHSSAVTSIKSAEPDWIFVTGYTQDLVLFRQQMADLGVEAPIVTMITGPAYKEFTDNLGDLAEGVTSATWWHHSTPYQGDDVFRTPRAFYDAVQAMNGEDADYVYASSAAALIALTKAIEIAGSTDRDAVREALRTMEVNTFFGPIDFRENGMNAARDLPVIQVQGGEIKVVNPVDIRTADMVLLGE